MDEEHVGEPLIIRPEHPDREQVRRALTGGPDAVAEGWQRALEPYMAKIRAQQLEDLQVDRAIQERIAVALEAIAGELREAREHPKFVATGMMVVKEGSPEHIQAALATGAIPRGPRG